MWNELVASPLFGIALTLGAYALAQRLYRRTGNLLFTPVALAIAVIILFLLLLDIPYAIMPSAGATSSFSWALPSSPSASPYIRRREILTRKYRFSWGLLPAP